MRYSITSNFKNLSFIWEKYVYHWEKWNFDFIMNSTHKVELLVVGKALNKSTDYLMLHASRQHVKKSTWTASSHSKQ